MFNNVLDRKEGFTDKKKCHFIIVEKIAFFQRKSKWAFFYYKGLTLDFIE